MKLERSYYKPNEKKMKYKITIQEITEREIPETEYKKIGGKEDNNVDDAYGYVETGQLKIIRTEKDVYAQEIEGLDLRELVNYINREKEDE